MDLNQDKSFHQPIGAGQLIDPAQWMWIEEAAQLLEMPPEQAEYQLHSVRGFQSGTRIRYFRQDVWDMAEEMARGS
ncbi:MAG: hypothetical protein HZA50_05910 [Planctomycetes bacterium]|nr:hypothetical protein [Planctomycetota bacterium]